jgi:hypothetical protein
MRSKKERREYVLMWWCVGMLSSTSSSTCPSTTMFVLAVCICFTTDFRSAGHDKYGMSPQVSNRHLSSFRKKVYNDARYHQLKPEPWIGMWKCHVDPGLAMWKMPTISLNDILDGIYSNSLIFRQLKGERTHEIDPRHQLSARSFSVIQQGHGNRWKPKRRLTWHDRLLATTFQHIWNDRRALREWIVLPKGTNFSASRRNFQVFSKHIVSDRRNVATMNFFVGTLLLVASNHGGLSIYDVWHRMCPCSWHEIGWLRRIIS